MALLEVSNHIYTLADHVAGVLNVWADSGSRMWASCEPFSSFQQLNRGYVQEEVVGPLALELFRNVSSAIV